ncbi:pilus assembly protein TadG-related protein [Massilia sp. CF038]|uniref:pilus assembly protein TadG-related protein n=1 Tax=Massilia sp. CF038 TaxID=1881045 RepID=UPI00091F0C65|nr:pilus assembly protein TadG-related protein [Massilia sp. CF038]SHH24966.1 Putative Flp pilus-assembly TadE/G-like [Massilia sp. CF038]
MRANLRNMKGQALILFLGFTAAIVGIALVAFNSGQVTNAKMRAMNAADAAAYSGAVWEARTLNFQAYMNRAMIANEVTIAQSVSLRSWIDYVARFISNINTVAQFVPYLGTATTAVSRVMDQVDRAAQQVLSQAESGIRTLNQAEHEAQVVINGSAPVIARELAREIAQRNGAETTRASEALFTANGVSYFGLTETYSRNSRPNINRRDDGRRRLRDVVLNSRDGFTRARDWSPNFWPLPFGFRKQGGTDLIDYDAWKAMDSAMLCGQTLFSGCKNFLPLGWGGAQAYNTQNPVSRIGRHGDRNDWNNLAGRAARLAAIRSPGANQIWNWRTTGQFPNYRDVQNFDTRNARANMLPFAVEVVIKEGSIPSANSDFQAKAALTDGSTIEHDPQYVRDGGVFALAESCVTFERPFNAPRVGGGREFPSLFNPYWRASMATEDRTVRLAVDAAKGVTPVAAIAAGRGSCR